MTMQEGGEGIVLHFGIRAIPRNTYGKDLYYFESFLAFNEFPCPKVPQFSAKIPVIMPSKLHPVDSTLTWDVRLKRMHFVDWVPENGSDPLSLAGAWVNREDLPLLSATDDSGIRVMLDTGSSVSWLPTDTIAAIGAHYGGIYHNSSSRFVGRPNSVQPFIVPPERHTQKHKIAMYFAGEQGSPDVKIEVDTEFFLYAENPFWARVYEGLVFEEEDSEQYVLGLNWFHVNYVAMHKPKTDLPYVRLAPQLYGSGLRGRYVLPPRED
ncbi:hypothetical protein C8Q79DRAFT_458958 [Trametes meyenii]|nr:hypothetical protein C8Q79DRAFT_458958 [Trametes meyenii]